MGLAIASTRFLARARQKGVRFDRVLTLGRQDMVVSPQRIAKILQECGLWPPPFGASEFFLRMAVPAHRFETFARALGATSVEACDFSDYEGAQLVHDLNLLIPMHWEEKFDLVIDAGTLEHVFNFPIAIANCMRMVKTGGHLVLLTPANNYSGHGFYQFSAELFYRVLSAENGFRVVRMMVGGEAEGFSTLFGVKYTFPIHSPAYEVHDAAEVGTRVTLLNSRPILLFVLAQKTSAKPLFAEVPHQAEYMSQWKKGAPLPPLSQRESGNLISNWLRRTFSESFCREVLPRLAYVLDAFRLRRFRRKNSCSNQEFYRRGDD